jgi:hypothetical protein
MKSLQHSTDRISQNNALWMLLKILQKSALFLWQLSVVGEGRREDYFLGCLGHAALKYRDCLFVSFF